MDKIDITINTDRSTSVGNCISENKRKLISRLKIIGCYKSQYDNETIRTMCNTKDENGSYTGGILEDLDLTQAIIYESDFGPQMKNNPGSLGGHAFRGCITLKVVSFGESLTNVSGSDFSGCISLEEINVSISNKKYSSRNGILYDILDTSCLPNKIRSEGEWVLIKVPATLKNSSKIDFKKIRSIGNNAFENTSLQEIIMPEVAPICTKEAFKDVDVSKIKLIVPKGAFNNYWSHPVWGSFQIEERTYE